MATTETSDQFTPDLPEATQIQPLLRQLAQPKRAHEVNDERFDEIYPSWAGRNSKSHWTPVQVAVRVADLLTEGQPRIKILDIGSGVGKFCLVGALASPRATFHGIEQRPHFVELAQRLSTHYRIARTSYFHADLATWDWRRYHAIYLYNPFQENRLPGLCLDRTVELEKRKYDSYVSITQDRLRQMPSGTRVATYHGFGGAFPENYVRRLAEYCVRGPLEIWEKRR